MSADSRESFSFPIPGRVPRTCADCGREFRGNADAVACSECNYRRNNPHTRDRYWTWLRAGERGWQIQAFWPSQSPLPEPGDQVEVHRQDGSTSTMTVREVLGTHYTRSVRMKVRCSVE